MGGTNLDVSILRDRRIPTTNEFNVEDYKNAVEGIDVASIGAGGGSIARIDKPWHACCPGRAAGAGNEPGPVCLRQIAGSRPTLTDADVILGYIARRLLRGRHDAGSIAKVWQRMFSVRKLPSR